MTYTDIPFILLGVFIMLSLLRKITYKENTTSNNIILEDAPLYELNDYYIFDQLIEKINPALFHDNYKYALSIAIIGPWGCGKSSFLKAVEYKVTEYNFNHKKKQDLIFIPFSPFLNHGKEEVTYEFFIQLSNILKSYHGKLSNDLVTYAKKLSNLSSDLSLGNLLKITESDSNKKSVEELYQSINEAIIELNKKIIVAIDDVDRLNGTEIIEVLKLIRNSSNFSNTVFLVAMDKKHVLESIEKTESINENYLDKFFQLELHLDFITGQSVTEAIKIYVKQVAKALEFTKNKTKEIVDSFWNNTIITDFIKSHRDAKRLINQFFIDYRCINSDLEVSEIEIKDIILLTILKQKNYDLLITLKDRSTPFLNYDIGQELHIINPKSTINNHFFPPGTVSYYTNPDDFELVVEGQHIEIANKRYPKELGILLINLFGVNNTSASELSKTSPLSIKHPTKLNLYFERVLPESEISNSEYSEIMNLDNNMALEIFNTEDFKARKLKSFRRHLQSELENATAHFERYIDLLSIINSIQPSFHDIHQICELFQKTLASDGQDKFNSVISRLLNNQKLQLELQIEIVIKLIEEYDIKEFKPKLNMNSPIINYLIDYKSETDGVQKLKKLQKLLKFINDLKDISKLIVSDFKSKVSQIDISELLEFAIQTNTQSHKLNRLILQIYPSLYTLVEDLERFKNSKAIPIEDIRELLMLIEISNNSTKFKFIFEASFLKESIKTIQAHHQCIYQVNDKALFEKMKEKAELKDILKSKTSRYKFLTKNDSTFFLLLVIETNPNNTVSLIMKALGEIIKEITPKQATIRSISGREVGPALTINDIVYVSTISIQPKIVENPVSNMFRI